MTEGISRAIGELAAAQRLSATSVMVNSPHWPAAAPRLRAHRGHLSIGLHLNLTLGTPVGPMPRLAPAGSLSGPARRRRAGLPRPPRWRRGPGRDRAPARSLRGGAAIPSRPYRRASAHPGIAEGERRAREDRATALFGKAAAAPRSDRRVCGHRRPAPGGAKGHVGRGSRARLCGRGAPARAAGQRQLCRLLRLRRRRCPTPTSCAARCCSRAGGTSSCAIRAIPMPSLPASTRWWPGGAWNTTRSCAIRTFPSASGDLRVAPMGRRSPGWSCETEC